MTLDEAIAHAKELSENKSVCKDCREEHKQLAKWLEELRDYKSIFEEKKETNIEHYKDGIIELCVDDLAISKGKVVECGAISCSECDFADKSGHCIGSHEIINWLKQAYRKSPYKLTKFENDLLQSYLGTYKFKEVRPLTWMKEKGHFKGVDENETIDEILANSEVIEDRKEVAND